MPKSPAPLPATLIGTQFVAMAPLDHLSAGLAPDARASPNIVRFVFILLSPPRSPSSRAALPRPTRLGSRLPLLAMTGTATLA